MSDILANAYLETNLICILESISGKFETCFRLITQQES